MYVRVDHDIGNDGLQMPRRLRFDGHHVDVIETLDQWHGPDYRYVKLRGGDGSLYILRYDAERDDWELTMYESLRAQEFSARSHAGNKS